MQRPEPISLPAAKLIPGPDDDLIEWLETMRQKDVNISAFIRKALRVYIAREDEIKNSLNRIEAGIIRLLDGNPSPESKSNEINDPLLGGL